MSDAPGFLYMVLSEGAGGPHWVCIRRDGNPDWLQVVARFANRDRAEQYAEVENHMASDDPDDLRGDELKDQPSLPLPASALPKLLPRPLITAPVEAAEEAEEPPEVEEEPGCEEGEAGRIPELIVRLLPFFMEKREGGPTIKDVVAQCRLPEADIRAAFNEIKRRNLAIVYQSHGGAPLQVAPLGFDPPPKPELSQNQAAILNYLSELPSDEDDTVAPASQQAMHEETGVPKGSLGAAISDLERKQKIEVVSRGDQFKPSRYRVVDRTILRQAMRDGGGVRDVSALVFADPPFERSALAEHKRREAQEAESPFEPAQEETA